MKLEITCPCCGEEDSLDRKFDAWACFTIEGLDSEGQLKQSAEMHTQVFDDSVIECSECGKAFEERAIIEHLRALHAAGSL